MLKNIKVQNIINKPNHLPAKGRADKKYNGIQINKYKNG